MEKILTPLYGRIRLSTAILAVLAVLAVSSTNSLAARTVETESFSLVPQTVAPSETIPGDEGNEAEAPPRISYDVTLLPKAVQKKRQALIDAARTGNVGALRRIFDENGYVPALVYDEVDDPIQHLKDTSGDGEGQEILAILLEVLQAGYAHVRPDTDEEIFVWPYFAHIRLDTLSPEQRVELFTLVTAGDYEDMKSFGAYNFFRLGISPDGVWQYFLAGD
ncbi:MAG: hypothetical protein ABJO09_07375 [Hyphomicrobiales bacterium]